MREERGRGREPLASFAYPRYLRAVRVPGSAWKSWTEHDASFLMRSPSDVTR